MDTTAPTPSGRVVLKGQDEVVKTEPIDNSSAASVTVVGCGGAGINLARAFKNTSSVHRTLFFDTSSTNIRPGETVKILTNGSGSGSNRAENASDIERTIPQLSDDEDLGKSDVAIVIFSLAGGSGSVAGPLLIRDYIRRNVRVVGVAIADTSSSVGAKNTNNTLKTLSAITKNNDIYLPMIILSNDVAETRGQVDAAAVSMITALIGMLTTPVYEVDRNDRLNWINPKKVIDTNCGIKLMTFICSSMTIDGKLVLGNDSKEMVDSLLILQKSPDEKVEGPLPPARLKKTGFYIGEHPNIVGKVSSDISSINLIVDHVEKMFKMTESQKHSVVERINVSGGDDLIL